MTSLKGLALFFLCRVGPHPPRKLMPRDIASVRLHLVNGYQPPGTRSGFQ
jgi:hypothetical protein